MDGGHCRCGAVYVCDPTGHNVGEALCDALAIAKGNWDVASIDDSAYRTAEIDYDLRSHTRIYRRGLHCQTGKLLFVRNTPLRPASVRPQQTPSTNSILEDSAFAELKLKDRVRILLEKKLFEYMGTLALNDKKVLKWLISFSYDLEDAITWRAIEAMGYAANALRATQVAVLWETIRKLLWSMTDESGSVGWSSPAHLGEIVRSDPDGFQEIIPLIWSFRSEDTLRPGVLWAMRRIAELRPEKISFALADINELFEDRSSEVRGYLALLIRSIPDARVQKHLERLKNDEGRVLVYEAGELRERCVADLLVK